jgi:hypothetical protein
VETRAASVFSGGGATFATSTTSLEALEAGSLELAS